MAYTAQQLLAMPEKQLDDLFSASPAGDIPNGEAEGTAIVASDTPFSSEIAAISIFLAGRERHLMPRMER